MNIKNLFFNRFIVTNGVTFFGIGYLKPAPGTWASLVTIPLVILFKWLVESLFFDHAYIFYIVSWILLALLAWLLIIQYEKHYGHHDESCIVIDEVVGQSLPILLLSTSLLNCVLAFILFRIFDIFKFGPILWADEKISTGLGTLLDDVFAGILTTLVLGIIFFIIY